MDIESSPFPPLQSTSLPRTSASSATRASTSVPSILPRNLTASANGIPRTTSQPQLTGSRTPSDPAEVGLPRSHSLVKIHSRPRASFGHAITCEESAAPTRQKTQAYVSSHHRQSSLSTPLQKLPDTGKHRRESFGMADPSTAATSRTRQSSDNTMTGRSIRSVGSSFDIELYTQMQLQENSDSLEEEMRRSFSNPLAVDGAMDFPSPTRPRSPVPSPGEHLGTRAHYQIPELVFRQPAFDLTPELGMPSPRPHMQGGRKVSYYTHPRRAPTPPVKEECDVKRLRYADAAGRPISPSKGRARQNGSRTPLQSLPPQNVEDDEDVLLPYLSEEHANRLLMEDDHTMTGYGLAYR